MWLFKTLTDVTDLAVYYTAPQNLLHGCVNVCDSMLCFKRSKSNCVIKTLPSNYEVDMIRGQDELSVLFKGQ